MDSAETSSNTQTIFWVCRSAKPSGQDSGCRMLRIVSTRVTELNAKKRGIKIVFIQMRKIVFTLIGSI
jgi:hypothetical protein